jgi:hypothetical protein
MPVKRGDTVRVVREKLENSLEAQASDTRFPSYLFETKGEIVDIKGDYAPSEVRESANTKYVVTFGST